MKIVAHSSVVRFHSSKDNKKNIYHAKQIKQIKIAYVQKIYLGVPENGTHDVYWFQRKSLGLVQELGIKSIKIPWLITAFPPAEFIHFLPFSHAKNPLVNVYIAMENHHF